MGPAVIFISVRERELRSRERLLERESLVLEREREREGGLF